MATTDDITAHVDTDVLLSVLLDGRYRLTGDENCGVGIECRDHFDGGQPLGYYQSPADRSPYPAEVVSVDSIPALLAVAVDHEARAHGPEGQASVNIPGIPDSIPRARVLELIESLGIDPRQIDSLELKGRGIEAVVFALNEEGRRYFVDGTPDSPVARHRITIPITDAPETHEIGRAVVDAVNAYEGRGRGPGDPEPQPA